MFFRVFFFLAFHFPEWELIMAVRRARIIVTLIVYLMWLFIK